MLWWKACGGAVLVAAALLVPSAALRMARSQDRPGEGWVGRWVVGRSHTFVVRDGHRDVRAGGFHRYRVQKVVGRDLLLRVDGGAPVGWATGDQVIPEDQALDYFTRRIGVAPRDFYALIRRAIAFRDKNDPAPMLADLKLAMELEPENPMVYSLRAEARRLRGEYDAAIGECNRALRFDPQSFQAYFSRGMARREKKDHEGAIDDLTRAIQLEPGCATAYGVRGLVRIDMNDGVNAIVDLTEAIRLDPLEAASYANRGRAWFHRGKLESAIVDYSRAIDLAPKEARCYAGRSRVWLESGKLDAALVDCETAIRLDPALAPGYFCRGLIAYQRSDLKASLADLDEAIRLNPRDFEARLWRGIVRQSRNDERGAIADYAEAARLEPTSAIAHNNLAWIRASCPDAALRNGKEAIASATRACELTNWRAADYIDTIAAAYAEAGQFDAAIKAQEEANAMFPEGPARTTGEGRLKFYRAGIAYHRQDP